MLAVRSKPTPLEDDRVYRGVPEQTGLLRILEDLERYTQSLKDNGVALANVRETRTNLQRLADKMDALESGFDRITERSRTLIMLFLFMAGS